MTDPTLDKFGISEKQVLKWAMSALGKRTSEAKRRSCKANALLSWSPQAREKRKSKRKHRVS